MAMKLYYSPGACSLAAHIVAIEGGLDLQLEKVDLKTHRTETGADFMAINPKGYVPAVELDDGSLLTENTAILPFLGDKTGLVPADGLARYRALEWIGYIATELHKSFAPLFHDSSDKEKTEAKAQIFKRLLFIEEGLPGDWLMGENFSAPDAYLFVILRWARTMHLDMKIMPRLLAFKARMEARPGVQKALAEEGLHRQ
jgi:glutathione S-transferase